LFKKSNALIIAVRDFLAFSKAQCRKQYQFSVNVQRSRPEKTRRYNFNCVNKIRFVPLIAAINKFEK